MAQESNTVIAFDVYGTLLSTSSISKQLAQHFGEEKAQELATTARKYQLEYTWRLNSMNQYEPFSTITLRSLKHALADSSLSLPQKDLDSLMKAYDSLGSFPDVSDALSSLKDDASITPAIFSNGTTSMIKNSLSGSPDLSPHASVFKHVVVVEEPRKFKPAPEVYYHLAKQVGKEGRMGEMWLVSGNPFDVVGARAVGMNAAWVDREGKGWADCLIEGEKGRPSVIVKGLGEVVEAVRKFQGKK